MFNTIIESGFSILFPLYIFMIISINDDDDSNNIYNDYTYIIFHINISTIIYQ